MNTVGKKLFFGTLCLMLISASASAQSHALSKKKYSLKEATAEIESRRSELIDTLNMVSTMNQQEFEAVVEKIAGELDRSGKKEQASEIRTLKDPAVKPVMERSVRAVLDDTAKNSIYFWFTMNRGEFCKARYHHYLGYPLAGGYRPFYSVFRCMTDIFFSIITLGEQNLDGAGEI